MNWNFLNGLFGRNKPRLESSGRTDTGRKRPQNEDSFAIINRHRLFIVADGMGGHKAGEVASRNAVNILAEYLIANRLSEMAGDQAGIQHTLFSGFTHTNEAIMAMADANEAYAGMGSTLIACYVDHSHVHLCHVGDVRGYSVTAAAIAQLTKDHTYAAEYLDRVPQDNTAVIPPQNIVSQAIGFPFRNGPDYNATPYQPGKRILICSDGLWGMLDDPMIQAITSSADSPDQACERLVDQANEAGGKDNITVVSIFLG